MEANFDWLFYTQRQLILNLTLKAFISCSCFLFNDFDVTNQKIWNLISVFLFLQYSNTNAAEFSFTVFTWHEITKKYIYTNFEIFIYSYLFIVLWGGMIRKPRTFVRILRAFILVTQLCSNKFWWRHTCTFSGILIQSRVV